MLAEFLESLFEDGDLVFRSAPPAVVADANAAVAVLRRAFDIYRLEIAGPLIEFDESVAFAAAVFVWRSCWYLVHRDASTDEVNQRLHGPTAAGTAGQHLSADLTFRYLPTLHRRARALGPDDVLTTKLAEILRAWPLSGVMSDLDDPPTTALHFDGHAGLEMLYAERFVRLARHGWRASGRLAEFVQTDSTHGLKKMRKTGPIQGIIRGCWSFPYNRLNPMPPGN